MKKRLPAGPHHIVRSLKKLALSVVIVIAFGVYAVSERLAGTGAGNPPITVPTPGPLPTAPSTIESHPTLANIAGSPTPPVATATPIASPVPSTPKPQEPVMYKDGVYSGDRRSALWGMVQVAAIVRGGRLVWVEFLDYPQDRDTSVRINATAVPALQSEAIKAQSAEVDIISGATLTSQAFYWSLYSALKKAKR